MLSASGWQCGDGFAATVHYPDETATATLSSDGLTINISAVYVGGWPFNSGNPYSWTGTIPVAGGTGTATDSLGNPYTFPVVLVTTVVSTYATHGAYVTAMGGGDDAARSCIGMPIVAQPQNIGPTREEVVRADDLFFLPNGFGASAARIAAPSPRRRP